MKASPDWLRRRPPSPLTASLMSADFACGWKRQVGWNCAAGRQQRDPRLEAVDGSAVGVEHVGPEGSVLAGASDLLRGEEIDGAVILEHGDVGVGSGVLQQHLLDLPPGGVAMVEDTAMGVPPLSAQVEFRLARGSVAARGIEDGAQVEQRLDHGRTPLDHVPHHVLVAEAIPRGHGVARVVFEGIVLREDAGDPALGLVGGRVGGLLLGDQRDRPVLGHAQRVEEPGDAAADHQHVETGVFGQVPPGIGFPGLG
jgi:hypothetical protein